IVGGGPAGLTAAIYAVRKRLNFLLVSQDWGGKTNFGLSLPDTDMQQVVRGLELVDKFRRELEYLEFARHVATVTTIDKKDHLFTVKTSAGVELSAKSVIFAAGSQVKRLNVPGEQDYLGRGLTYSALSYAPLMVNKQVVVIGDGPLALRAMAELVQVAAKVNLLMPSRGVLDRALGQKLVHHPKVELWIGYQVEAIMGNDFAQRVRLEAPDGEYVDVVSDCIFVELGLLPNSDPVKGLVELDEQGRVMIDKRNGTSCLGLFAAGDVTNAYAEQVVIAVGEGAKAALSAYEYLLTTF
ncbi:MAG TPA: FAD-dependent oxidoreductase, partial [Anaerolineae bacterium]|nr:FAD-dependent oxidoreductase [Anaerolineae bacterium]